MIRYLYRYSTIVVVMLLNYSCTGLTGLLNVCHVTSCNGLQEVRRSYMLCANIMPRSVNNRLNTCLLTSKNATFIYISIKTFR